MLPRKSSATAVGYIRQSLGVDKQENSADVQKETLLRWAEANSIFIIAFFEDVDVSGDADPEHRPGLLSALACIQKFGADWLVVKSRDRLARDTFTAAWIERKLRRMKAGVVTAAEDPSYVDDSAERKLTNTIIDAAAEYELALIRRRTKDALAALKRAGKVLGPPRYEASDYGRLRIQEILTLHFEGMNYVQIADHMTDQGIKTLNGSSVWKPMQVRRLVLRHKNDPFIPTALTSTISSEIV